MLGAGAAGLMCAATAAGRARRAVVLEHAPQPGRKIAISGGGRCNFTNLHTAPGDFISRNPDFCRSALARFAPADFVALVERYGIAWHEKHSGQLFCDRSARAIVAMLLAECERSGAEVVLGCHVERVERVERVARREGAQRSERVETAERAGGGAARATGSDPDGFDGFLVETSRGIFECQSLVVATGGLSVPALGATDFGYRVARQFGLDIVEPRPALVPLTFAARKLEQFKDLAGVSLEAMVSCGKVSFAGAVLFTHRGISGPAILQISSYWTPGSEIVLDLFPGGAAASLLEEHRTSRQELHNLLAAFLPRRFAVAWAQSHGADRPLRQFTPGQLARIAEELHHWPLTPDATEGYRTAEVTAGGIDTAELSSKTLEARRVPGLYFIGEVVDVTGHLGGFNFQWAWASGHAAGEFV